MRRPKGSVAAGPPNTPWPLTCLNTEAAALAQLQCPQNLERLLLFSSFTAIVSIDQHIRVDQGASRQGGSPARRRPPRASTSAPGLRPAPALVEPT